MAGYEKQGVYHFLPFKSVEKSVVHLFVAWDGSVEALFCTVQHCIIVTDGEALSLWSTLQGLEENPEGKIGAKV